MQRALILSLVFLMVSCGFAPPDMTRLAPPPHTPAAGRSVTIDGYDPQSKTVISPVNIWNNYTDRSKGVAGTVLNGQYVTLIRQEGNGVLIETPTGVRGWVSASFIKELH